MSGLPSIPGDNPSITTGRYGPGLPEQTGGPDYDDLEAIVLAGFEVQRLWWLSEQGRVQAAAAALVALNAEGVVFWNNSPRRAP